MSLADYDLKKISLFLGSIIILIIAIAGSVTAYHFYNKYRSAEDKLRQASVTATDNAQELIAKVGKLIKLPEGELPTIATVTDLSKLQSQPFFAKAKIGDKVLLFMEAKKAFLYDPVENKIIEVGPLIIPTPTGQLAEASSSGNIAGLSTQAPTPKSTEATTTASLQAVKIAVYNSTDTAGLADRFEKELLEKVKEVTVTQKSNSAKKDYAKSVIIDLSGTNSVKTEEIAKALNLTVSALPSDEKPPSGADLLIILAPDKI